MNEKLIKLEKCIGILEEELRELKREVAVLKDTEKVEKESAEGSRKRHEKTEVCRLMSENIIPAFEVYEKIRRIAQKEGIRFNGIRGGIFAALLRKSKHYSGYIKKSIANGESLVSEKFYEECVNGKHPKLYRLLTSEDSHDIVLIKAAILEEIEENNFYTAEAYSYEYLEKFTELVKNFEE